MTATTTGSDAVQEPGGLGPVPVADVGPGAGGGQQGGGQDKAHARQEQPRHPRPPTAQVDRQFG